MLTSFYSDVHSILTSPTTLCKFPKKVWTSFRIGNVLLEMSHLPLFPFRRAIKRHYSGAVLLPSTGPCYIVISVSLETFSPLKQVDSDIVKILVAPRITPHCHSDRWEDRRHWNATAVLHNCPIDKHSQNWNLKSHMRTRIIRCAIRLYEDCTRDFLTLSIFSSSSYLLLNFLYFRLVILLYLFNFAIKFCRYPIVP